MHLQNVLCTIWYSTWWFIYENWIESRSNDFVIFMDVWIVHISSISLIWDTLTSMGWMHTYNIYSLFSTLEVTLNGSIMKFYGFRCSEAKQFIWIQMWEDHALQEVPKFCSSTSLFPFEYSITTMQQIYFWKNIFWDYYLRYAIQPTSWICFSPSCLKKNIFHLEVFCRLQTTILPPITFITK